MVARADREIPRSGRLLTADEVKRIFRISDSSLYRRMQDGRLPKPKDTGTAKRFWKAEEIWQVYDSLKST